MELSQNLFDVRPQYSIGWFSRKVKKRVNVVLYWQLSKSILVIFFLFFLTIIGCRTNSILKAKSEMMLSTEKGKFLLQIDFWRYSGFGTYHYGQYVEINLSPKYEILWWNIIQNVLTTNVIPNLFWDCFVTCIQDKV